MIEDNRLPVYESSTGASGQKQSSKLSQVKPLAESQWRLSQIEYDSNPFASLTYFQLLRVMLKENRLFFFHQIMSGNFIKQVFKRFGLGCLCTSSSNLNFVETLFLNIYNSITPKCLSNSLRPFLCGMFVPMILYFYLNYEYIKSDINVNWIVLKVLEIFMIVLVILFLILGVSSGGNLKTDIWRYRSAGITTQKPWLKTQKLYCIDCKIIKPIRSHHCNLCKRCTPKYTKHSIILNQCIGASNELFYMIFQGLFFVLITFLLALLAAPKQPLFTSFRVFIIRFIFFIINSFLQGESGFEFLRGALYTVNYNCTEHEVNTWSRKAYLCTFDRYRFYNPFETTIPKHLTSSVYAFFGCSDDEGENKIQNWAKTFFYYPSHIPNHHEHMQWVLYYQQLEQEQSTRYRLLQKEIQILSKIENTKSWESRQIKQLKQDIEVQNNNIQLLYKSKTEEENPRETYQTSQIHSISDVDCRGNRDVQLLHQQKVNRSTI